MPSFTNGLQAGRVHRLLGRLNLRDKSDAVGEKEAIDLLNVTFTERGAVRQRDGYSDLTPSDLTNRVDSLSPSTRPTARASSSPAAGRGWKRSTRRARSSPHSPG
jgi:hypothetical protein